MIVNIDNPTALFNNHLAKKDNKHILFSAPFGYGKSYFLEKFFESHSNYKAFWLSPVKYVVGNNEDIFEYIKLDISMQILFSPEFKAETSTSFDEDLYIHQYLVNNPNEVFKRLLETVIDLDIPILKQGLSLVKNGLKSKEEYTKWKNEFKASTRSEFEVLDEFTKSQYKVKGSIYEDDIVTQIIRLALQSIKHTNHDPAKDEGKTLKRENVLIIDDFDRLDPEHIFRILNILSVHQNYTSEENKFGFDKIIIVCSVNNIKKIYEHKYGQGVDFDGFIAKFYSTQVFHFNNQNAISYYCQDNFYSHLDDSSIRLLGFYLSLFASKGKLSVRGIIKHQRISMIPEFILSAYEFPLEINKIDNSVITTRHTNSRITTSKAVWGDNYKSPINPNTKIFHFNNSDFPFLKALQILTTIFGDYQSLKAATVELKNMRLLFPEVLTYDIIKAIMPLIHFIHNFSNIEALFTSKNLKSYTVEPYSYVEEIPTYDLPQNKFLETSFTIPVGWNSENQYDGTTGFYSLVNENFPIDSDYSPYHQNLQSQLMTFLNTILDFVERENLLEKMGITTSNF